MAVTHLARLLAFKEEMLTLEAFEKSQQKRTKRIEQFADLYLFYTLSIRESFYVAFVFTANKSLLYVERLAQRHNDFCAKNINQLILKRRIHVVFRLRRESVQLFPNPVSGFLYYAV